MEEFIINCSPGVSGDMLLGALFDLGVPQNVIEKPFSDLGLRELYSLSFIEKKSKSIRGIKAQINVKDNPLRRDWRSIKELISKGNFTIELEKKIIEVFQILAEAEGKVHGIDPEDVHFHEIGSIDSLIDIIGVCTAFHFLKPKRIYSNLPTLGNGFAQTEHGKITIPSPAVIELVTKNNIKICQKFDSEEGELSTPTGVALLICLVDSFEIPYTYSINSYGVGIGDRKISCPNLTRVLNINSFYKNSFTGKISPQYEEICIQEAWIDDQSPEDIASFVKILRDEGAYDVSYKSINMKKGRIGYSLTAILPIDKEEYFRDLWFNQSNTIGLRERRQGRWTLLRRKGKCMTDYGQLNFKQIINSNGEYQLKPESDEIISLQKEHKKSAEEIRKIINKSIQEFLPIENWE